jgi:hypothetical protein
VRDKIKLVFNGPMVPPLFPRIMEVTFGRETASAKEITKSSDFIRIRQHQLPKYRG